MVTDVIMWHGVPPATKIQN